MSLATRLWTLMVLCSVAAACSAGMLTGTPEAEPLGDPASPANGAAPSPSVQAGTSAQPPTPGDPGSPSSPSNPQAITAGPVRSTESEVSLRHYDFRVNADGSLGSTGGNIVETRYPVRILENDFLKVTVLPGYGGRILSITYKPTGHELLYQNPVASAFGRGQGSFYYNWLAVHGGIFPTFPEAEHGKMWLLPWESAVIESSAEKASVRMSKTDDIDFGGKPGQFRYGKTGISVNATVTLYRNSSFVELALEVQNNRNASLQYEYWTCYTFAPGSKPGDTRSPRNSEIVAPVATVKARDDAWGWMSTVDQKVGDHLYSFQNLRRFDAWPDMGIAYAHPRLEQGWLGVINHENEIGVFRSTDKPEVALGLKIWTWGRNSTEVNQLSPGENNGARPYIELWTGHSNQFFAPATLAANEKKQWKDIFLPTVGLSRISSVNQHGAVWVGTEARGEETRFVLDHFSTHPGATLQLSLALQGPVNKELGQQSALADPTKPSQLAVLLPRTELPSGSYRLVAKVGGQDGAVLMSFEQPVQLP